MTGIGGQEQLGIWQPFVQIPGRLRRTNNIIATLNDGSCNKDR
jgi:hypothetical protein